MASPASCRAEAEHRGDRLAAKAWKDGRVTPGRAAAIELGIHCYLHRPTARRRRATAERVELPSQVRDGSAKRSKRKAQQHEEVRLAHRRAVLHAREDLPCELAAAIASNAIVARVVTNASVSLATNVGVPQGVS
jgi:hypothetical protein